MSKRDDAIRALVHSEAVCDHYQAMRALSLSDKALKTIGMAQQVNLSIADEIRKEANIKDPEAEVFLPAFPKSEWKHIRAKKPFVANRHIR